MGEALTDRDRQLMREYVERWKWVGPELEKIRRRKIENADTKVSVSRLFPETRFTFLPRRTTSGLVEQQAWFAKLRG